MIDHRSKGNGYNSASSSRREISVRNAVLGQMLRQTYREVVNEPVPDEFLRLLRKLDDGSEN